MVDEHRQNALADVIESARLLHALRELSAELETLLAGAIRTAHGEGLSQAIIAEAAALSPGRVSQIVSGSAVQTSHKQLHDRIYKISEWPGDALRPYRASFTGRMTFPPYARRRGDR